KEFHAVVDGRSFQEAFGALSSEGHSLQRVPPGYPADHPDAETWKMKDWVFGRRLSDHEAMSPHLPDVMADSFEAAMPVFRYLATIGCPSSSAPVCEPRIAETTAPTIENTTPTANATWSAWMNGSRSM